MQTIYVLYTEYDHRPVDNKAFSNKQALIDHYNIEYHSIPSYSMPDWTVDGWGKKGNPNDLMLYIEEFTLNPAKGTSVQSEVLFSSMREMSAIEGAKGVAFVYHFQGTWSPVLTHPESDT